MCAGRYAGYTGCTKWHKLAAARAALAFDDTPHVPRVTLRQYE